MGYKTAPYDLRLFALALTPSILGGTVCVITALLLVGSIVLDVQLKGSFLPIIFSDWGNLAVSEGGDTTYGIIFQDITNKLSAFMVWALFGLFIIVAAASIYQVVHNTQKLSLELSDQRLNHRKIIKMVLQRFAVHAGVFIIWSMYTWVFFKFIVAYILAASATGAADLPQLMGVGYIALAAVVTAISLHIHIVLLRLLVLRPRVFGSVNSVIAAQVE